MEQIILEEDIDENYEPTPEEIDEYASWLGMKRPEDEDLLWIACEGLKAPLPEHWKPCKTQDGDIYYFNFQTGESMWEHPCDEYYKTQYAEEKKKLQDREKRRAREEETGQGAAESPRRAAGSGQGPAEAGGSQPREPGS